MKNEEKIATPVAAVFFIFHFSFFILHSLGRAIGAVVAQLLYTETVGGSNPSSPTILNFSFQESCVYDRNFIFRMVVQHEDAVRREVIIARKGVAREVVVHRLVKLDADG
jgi:hypothetical protein